ncbi:hypothetical protein FRB99_007270 [Tulasnella sp. 403]|nr:hypothetical protein FRB99_007270 [Tulasnella sp. 403]
MISSPLFFTTLIALSSVATVSALKANTPGSLVQCENATITWDGNNSPFTVYVFTGCSDENDAPVAQFTNVNGNSVVWDVTGEPGSEVFFQVSDNAGNDSYSDDVTIQGNPNKDACNAQPAAAAANSSSSQTPSATPTSTVPPAGNGVPSTLSPSSTASLNAAGIANAAQDTDTSKAPIVPKPTGGSGDKAGLAGAGSVNGASTLVARPLEVVVGLLAVAAAALF